VPGALVLAPWKTLVVTWAFPGLILGPDLEAAIASRRCSILEARENNAMEYVFQIEDRSIKFSRVAKQKNLALTVLLYVI